MALQMELLNHVFFKRCHHINYKVFFCMWNINSTGPVTDVDPENSPLVV